MMHQFGLQGMEKAFHRRIVPAVSLAAHRADDAVLGEPFLVSAGGILAAAVGVVHQTGQRAAALERHVQGSQRQLLGHLFVHRPTDHLAGKEVEHDGQI